MRVEFVSLHFPASSGHLDSWLMTPAFIFKSSSTTWLSSFFRVHIYLSVQTWKGSPLFKIHVIRLDPPGKSRIIFYLRVCILHHTCKFPFAIEGVTAWTWTSLECTMLPFVCFNFGLRQLSGSRCENQAILNERFYVH